MILKLSHCHFNISLKVKNENYYIKTIDPLWRSILLMALINWFQYHRCQASHVHHLLMNLYPMNENLETHYPIINLLMVLSLLLLTILEHDSDLVINQFVINVASEYLLYHLCLFSYFQRLFMKEILMIYHLECLDLDFLNRLQMFKSFLILLLISHATYKI